MDVTIPIPFEEANMWIVKGVLLGILLFIVGGLTYIGIRIAIALYLPGQQAEGGTVIYSPGAQVAYDIRIWLGPLHSSVILAALLAAIAIGLWIMRARATHTV